MRSPRYSPRRRPHQSSLTLGASTPDRGDISCTALVLLLDAPCHLLLSNFPIDAVASFAAVAHDIAADFPYHINPVLYYMRALVYSTRVIDIHFVALLYWPITFYAAFYIFFSLLLSLCLFLPRLPSPHIFFPGEKADTCSAMHLVSGGFAFGH